MGYTSYSVGEHIKINDIYSVFDHRFKKGYNFSGEMHNFWECVYVIEGCVTVSADARVHLLKAGEIIFHKPMEMHKFFVENNEDAHLFIFSYSASGILADKVSDKIFALNNEQKNIIMSFLSFLKEEKQKYMPENIRYPFMKYILLHDKSFIFLQMVATYITQLILSISQDEGIQLEAPASDTLVFKKAVDIINDKIYTSMSVTELADSLNISISGLKRIFDKYAGISIHKYYLMQKVKVATYLLQSGMRVGDVADKLGFSSQAYFSETYKRETGSNPSAIAKAFKPEPAPKGGI